jgi:hypothetical protein
MCPQVLTWGGLRKISKARGAAMLVNISAARSMRSRAGQGIAPQPRLVF